MTDFRSSTATQLRKRAAEYRDQARDTGFTGLARELSALAREYEEDAGRLERQRASVAKAPRGQVRPS